MNDIQKYEAIEELFDKSIRPALMADGGNLELDLVKGNEVVISFQGACGSCPSSAGGTLRGIERALRQNIDKDIVVIPTNAYGMNNEMNSRFGVKHPFGGKTYEEEMAEREKTSPLKEN
jgi:Fe-S cluster biogenesis protein NfuA